MNPDSRQYHDVKEVRRVGGKGEGGLKLVKAGKYIRTARSKESSVCGSLCVRGKYNFYFFSYLTILTIPFYIGTSNNCNTRMGKEPGGQRGARVRRFLKVLPDECVIFDANWNGGVSH
jgi:hypothetical protein